MIETKSTSNGSEEIEASTVGENAPKKPVKKKKSAVLVISLITLGIFAVLIVLAIILKDSLINYILLGTGVAELAAAIILFYTARQRERFICPECGTKRIHHRRWLSTSNKVTTSYYEVASHPEGNRKITYTHHYADTYTCPNCGCEMEENVNKSGGQYVEFNDGHVNDTRRAPNEF